MSTQLRPRQLTTLARATSAARVPQWGSDRGRLVRTVAIVAAVVALVGTAIGLDVSARQARGDAHRLEARRERQLASARNVLGATDGELGRTRTGVQSAAATAAAQTTVLAATYAKVLTTNQSLSDTRSELAGLQSALGLQGGQLFTLNTCLNGVSGALGAVSGGSTANAVAKLRSVGGACNQVLAPGGEGAVFPFDFADPYVLRVGSTYYGYATNAGGGAIQVIRSRDLRTWEWLGNALASLPAWAQKNHTWAPSVLPVGGQYVAYYTARDALTGLQCISAAVSARPSGPFVDLSAAPLMCQVPIGGSIDPSPFVDADGSLHLVWKSDGLDRVWSAPLRADGLAFTGPPAVLLAPDQGWEQGIIEGPSMTLVNGRYYLFYSGGRWNTSGYAVGYAVCASVNGPCLKPQRGPILASHGAIAGPGGGEVFTDTSGNRWMAYHAYTGAAVGYPNSRTLHLARLSFGSGVPRLTPP
jgi:glycosyl hydrolase family 43